MVKNIEIINNEDPSVQELLNKTAKDLHKKYNQKRKINEKFLKKKTPTQKVFSLILDVVCTFLFLFGFVICFSIVNTTLHGYMPNFAGYSNLIISSRSMVKSGFEVGDIVITHSVNPDSLNVDDKIAFYVYSPSYAFIDESKLTDVSDQVSKTDYTLTLKQLFGFQTEEIDQAAAARSDIVFHHIRAIYVDENGERWFKTYGSSNGSDDSWYINEKYVVGIQDESGLAKGVIGLVEFAGKPYGVTILLIPIAILVGTLIASFAKNIQIAKLELDCVEEKRKITDPICVKHNVGFQMSEKTKLKILAQSNEKNREEYIKLLWRNGKLPNNIKKYYMRKKLLLNTNKQLLELNRKCEKMFKQKKKPNKIAQFYLEEKEKIEARSESIKKRLKEIDKHKRAIEAPKTKKKRAKA